MVKYLDIADTAQDLAGAMKCARTDMQIRTEQSQVPEARDLQGQLDIMLDASFR